MAKNETKVIKVTDEQVAKLIEEGAELKKKVEKIDYRLAELKAVLGEEYGLEKGKHLTPSGAALTISETDTFTEINPIECRNLLTSMRMGTKFPQVVKIVVVALRSVIGEQQLSTLREKIGTTRSFKFTG